MDIGRSGDSSTAVKVKEREIDYFTFRHTEFDVCSSSAGEIGMPSIDVPNEKKKVFFSRALRNCRRLKVNSNRRRVAVRASVHIIFYFFHFDSKISISNGYRCR